MTFSASIFRRATNQPAIPNRKDYAKWKETLLLPAQRFGERHHGVGYSTLGALSLSLQKTIDVPGDMHGCLILTAPNGDTLSAIYDGTEGAPNANNFIVGATGTLTFTGGTGRFRGASGNAHFTADFSTIYPASSFLGGTTAPAQVMAFYSVEGTVSLHDGHDGDR